MKYLGIDWGEKRVGLSFADEVGIATPLPAATEAKKKERIAHIGRIINERGIGEIVIGYPYNMDGSIGFKARQVDGFIADLDKRFHLPIHTSDERLTSYQAEEDMKAAGRRDSRKSGTLDSRAATLILQDFLDLLKPPLLPDLPEDDDDDDDYEEEDYEEDGCEAEKW